MSPGENGTIFERNYSARIRDFGARHSLEIISHPYSWASALGASLSDLAKSQGRYCETPPYLRLASVFVCILKKIVATSWSGLYGPQSPHELGPIILAGGSRDHMPFANRYVLDSTYLGVAGDDAGHAARRAADDGGNSEAGCRAGAKGRLRLPLSQRCAACHDDREHRHQSAVASGRRLRLPFDGRCVAIRSQRLRRYVGERPSRRRQTEGCPQCSCVDVGNDPPVHRFCGIGRRLRAFSHPDKGARGDDLTPSQPR